MLSFQGNGVTVTLDPQHEPPTPVLLPRERVEAHRIVDGIDDANVTTWGTRPYRLARFVSAPGRGYVTAEQRDSLMVLYRIGRTFTLYTDLMKPLGGEPDAYAARFAPEKGSEPVFTPADPSGTLYAFDMTLRVR